MKHSPLATELYVRKIQPLLVENMIKIDERKLVYEEPEMIQTRSRVLEKRKREEEAKKKAKKGRVLVIWFLHFIPRLPLSIRTFQYTKYSYGRYGNYSYIYIFKNTSNKDTKFRVVSSGIASPKASL